MFPFLFTAVAAAITANLTFGTDNADNTDDQILDLQDDIDDLREDLKRMEQHHSDLLTIRQASRMLGVSEQTIRRRIKDNTLKATNAEPEKTNSQILIKSDDLRKWAKSQGKPIGNLETDQDMQTKKVATMTLINDLMNDPEYLNLMNDPEYLNLMIELTKSNIEICNLKIEDMEYKAKKSNEDDSENFHSKIIAEKIKKAHLRQNLLTYEIALKRLESLESPKQSENSQDSQENHTQENTAEQTVEKKC